MGEANAEKHQIGLTDQTDNLQLAEEVSETAQKD